MPQTVIITGCSTGLGKASALNFARKDWNVIATMRELETARDFAGLDSVMVTRLDVQDAVSISTAIETGVSHFGSIDVLVNNAGFGLFGIFESTPVEKIPGAVRRKRLRRHGHDSRHIAAFQGAETRAYPECQLGRRRLHSPDALALLFQPLLSG
jgi:NAD(P)-dependent dehydrogenase (short-subunit alcohol dehydrogenase family)